MSNFAKRIASSNARFVFFLVLIVLFSGALRLQYVLKNPTIVHDEAISYLAATGNQAAFQEVFDQKTFPYGEWASTADWQKFLQPRGHLIFKKIQTDLGIYDVHPPLYFWLLHLWVLVVGVHNWAGESLNILLGVINIVLVSFGARSLLKDNFKALAVGCIYAFSPGVMSSTILARSYELFTLFSILLLWGCMTLIFSSAPRRLRLCLLITLIVFLGLLTHYYFALFSIASIATYLIYGVWAHQGTKSEFWRKFVALSVASAGGLVAMLLAHPWFFQQFFSFGSQGQDFSLVDFFLRLLKIGLAVAGFFVEVGRRGAPVSSIVLLGLMSLLLIYGLIYSGQCQFRYPKIAAMLNPRLRFILLYAVITFSIISGLYLCFFAHQAVMGPQYIAPLLPLVSLFSVLFFNKWSHSQKTGILLLCGLIIFSGVLYANPFKKFQDDLKGPVKESKSILIDNARRGILLVYMMYLPRDKKVYCAMQDDFLEQGGWERGLAGRTLYLSALDYGNTEEKRERLLSRLRQSYDVALTPKGQWGLWGLGKAYEIR